MVLKIATTLSFLEHCDDNGLTEEFNCTDKAIAIAMVLVLIFLMHGSKVYDTLSTNNSITLNSSQQRLYYILPEKFTKEEALEAAKDIGIKERTAYNAINGLEKKAWIILNADGTYVKQL
mgnify:FL=1